jgi:zinc D-Ala-D-Ala carboxypeptidase
MAYISKLSQVRPDLQPEANFTDFVIDGDVLRDEPQIVLRKAIYESVRKINNVENYNSYGVVMQEIQTTAPRTSLGRLLKQATGASSPIFNEYLILPIDRPSVTIDSYLQKPLDIYKSTSLLRCIAEETSLKIPIGSIVKLEYRNNLKDEAVITKVFGELPPVLEENAVSRPDDAYKAPPCVENSAIQSTSDAVNGNQSAPVSSTSAPTPNMSTTPCTKIEVPMSNYTSIDPNLEISKYFTLRQLTTTSVSADNTPNQKQIDRLRLLCASILDPLREKYGNFTVNSAFRSLAVNTKIKGATNSQHLDGDAADIRFTGLPDKEAVFELYERILNDASIPYQQFIFECSNINSYWFHISQAREGRTAQRQVLSYGPWSDRENPSTKKIERKYLPYNRNTIKLGLANRGITSYFV